MHDGQVRVSHKSLFQIRVSHAMCQIRTDVITVVVFLVSFICMRAPLAFELAYD